MERRLAAIFAADVVVSPYLYNDRGDIDALVGAMEAAAR